jgi:hypothetical protein
MYNSCIISRSVTKFIHILGIERKTSFIKSEHLSIQTTTCNIYLKTAFDIKATLRTFATSSP